MLPFSFLFHIKVTQWSIATETNKVCACMCVCLCTHVHAQRIVSEPNARGIFQKILKCRSCQPFSEKPVFHLWKYISHHMQSRIITVFTEVMGDWMFLHSQISFLLITLFSSIQQLSNICYQQLN